MEKINFVEVNKYGDYQIRLTGDDQEHRVRLMTAAPEMYETLKALREGMDKGYEIIGSGREEKVLTALAKAEESWGKKGNRNLSTDLSWLLKGQSQKDLSDTELAAKGFFTRKEYQDQALDFAYGITFVESTIAMEWLARAIKAEEK